MSCQKLSRQYLHMVSSAGRGLYSLSHMDVSRLFYPSKEEAKAAQAKDKENGSSNILGGIGSTATGRLPEPSIHFAQFSSALESHPDRSRDVFALFGKSSILCSDSVGHAGVYDIEAHCLQGMPRMNSPKGPKRITVCILRTEAHARADFEVHPNVDANLFTDGRHGHPMNSLYVMNMDPYNQCCVEALVYYPDNPQVMVLTGVELDPDDHKGEAALGIAKHKSECLTSDSIVYAGHFLFLFRFPSLWRSRF
ncbi:hypothetical protein BAE44_0012082 [Dichanthelium oligosanthes]|uniref:Uncharacterized protein n=1 Tax=Dichanthelium oligosanthes TaxID=888268 RepID=A0A1E5VP79_9POAL|nr:hypothetical protein BAE44_0012082 [Dichanthelium oligosanthes]